MIINLIKKDMKLKLVSLIISIIIWFYIMGDLGYDIFFLNNKKDEKIKSIKKIPVYVLEDPSKTFKENIKINPKFIDINIKGKENDLKDITQKNITAYIDISGANITTAYFAIIKVIVPNNVEIIGDIKTATVEINTK